MSVRRLHPVQPKNFAFSRDNLAWAKAELKKYPDGKQASAIIPLLWRAQEQNGGWLTRPAMELVAEMLGMAFIRVLEVATFYTMFQLSPVGRKAHIQVCGTTPCMLRGAEELIKICRRKIHHDPHHLSADGDFSWEEAECLGACVNAPMVQIFKDTYEDLTAESFDKLIDNIAAGRSVKPGPQIDRQLSAPQGGQRTLTDPAIYSTGRKFVRREPPPPAPPASASESTKAAEVKAVTGAPIKGPMKEPAKAAADDRAKVVKPAARMKREATVSPAGTEKPKPLPEPAVRKSQARKTARPTPKRPKK